jgi:hypothetical protein
MLSKYRRQSSIPSTWSLFETIDSLNKLAEMMRLSRILKTRWLMHVHFFLKEPLRKAF